MNKDNMVNEMTSLGSFMTKPHLSKVHYNQEFGLLLTELSDEQVANADVYIKRLEPKGEQES